MGFCGSLGFSMGFVLWISMGFPMAFLWDFPVDDLVDYGRSGSEAVLPSIGSSEMPQLRLVFGA